MLTIGEFSKICRVSPKTLRYYEAIGLLQPRLVNPMTGYRFYAADQLETMRLINHLKAYSFTLEEIKLLVVTLSGGSNRGTDREKTGAAAAGGTAHAAAAAVRQGYSKSP